MKYDKYNHHSNRLIWPTERKREIERKAEKEREKKERKVYTIIMIILKLLHERFLV